LYLFHKDELFSVVLQLSLHSLARLPIIYVGGDLTPRPWRSAAGRRGPSFPQAWLIESWRDRAKHRQRRAVCRPPGAVAKHGLQIAGASVSCQTALRLHWDEQRASSIPKPSAREPATVLPIKDAAVPSHHE